MTMRMMPPADGLRNTITLPSGRSYTCAPGSTIVVPDADGFIMAANGWLTSSVGGAGTTAQRPANPLPRSEFHDDTLGKVVRFDGKVWRDPSTGAAV